MVAVLGVGGPEVKKGLMLPIPRHLKRGQPMVLLVATMSSMPPLCSSMVSQRSYPASPKAVPAFTRSWYTSERQRNLRRWHPEVSLTKGASASG